MGLGNRALQRIPTDDDLRVDLDAVRVAIARDRDAGFQPACVIGNAGTVNTGAIDDLRALADLAVQENLWFHVDGCIGALLAIAPNNAYLVRGLERADSVALDPHKWLHAPFEVGCALVRDATAHRASFSVALGGLMSYGSSVLDLGQQAAIYIGKILNGAKPADLPIQLSTKVEL
jgi:glutamate/tyrosine decarboxylase-like PLP-dependent enzyme